MDRNKVCNLPPASVATNATAKMAFDTKGLERANVRISMPTSATTSAVYTTLKWSESDTVTSVSSMTDIVALTGGTATSTSAGFVLPTSATLENGGVVEFQIDLRARKRYMALSITPAQTQILGVVADFEANESGDTTTEKKITNYESTSAAAIANIIEDK
jgi:hypothetical protein